MHGIRGRLAALLLAVSAVVAGTVAPAEAGQQEARRGWTGTWATAASEHYEVSGMSEVTVRMPVHTSVGGSAVRIRLTNAYAADPVTIGHATVGLRDGGSAVARPYDLRFGGKRAVTIPAGGQAVSDPVGLAVPALTDLVVSLHLPGQVTHITDHWWAQQTVYWTDYGAGDHAADTSGDAYTWTTTSWPFLSGVDVTAPRTGAVVALGDSITDGSYSTADTNQRWPDLLSARLNACLPGAGVLNAGITSNRITAGTETNPSALDRLDRDVLSQPGARTLILFEGINDLGGASAEQIIAGMKTIAHRAHQRGLRVVGATITPYKDFTWGGWTEETETRRQQVNAFVRASGKVFDGYADFDRAVRDPADPRRLGAATPVTICIPTTPA
ncbi:GDSL-type esterase/lipase family protein [Streptomyces sp. NBC_00882]|uniref:GDSL-type esterase/lipase family protein n=1 Tax=Streptomyces TaxID=1883 RepID=UPI00386A2873|nr:GDSL-type esterase/lipase family protein [Streptomyces sp. NBC_00882]WSZ56030.1 GDSL-type esterase/lipase family protein [Streptomyces canus]